MIRIIILSFLVAGCGGYHYIHNSDGCELIVASGRDAESLGIEITPDCHLKGSAGSLKANQKKIEALNSLINKIP